MFVCITMHKYIIYVNVNYIHWKILHCTEILSALLFSRSGNTRQRILRRNKCKAYGIYFIICTILSLRYFKPGLDNVRKVSNIFAQDGLACERVENTILLLEIRYTKDYMYAYMFEVIWKNTSHI